MPPVPEPAALRRATPADADAIADVYLASFASTYDFALAHTDAEIRAWIAGHVIGELETWVASESSVVVGDIALSETMAVQLDVKPGRTGEGIGSRFIEQVKVQRPDGFELWTFRVNAGARRFYERHGFEVVELGDGSGNEEHQPDVRYAWRP